MGTSTSGIIFDVKKFAIHDGPGIRTTVFLKGCPLNCWWCHNPESQHFFEEKITNSQNKQEIIGRKVSINEIMKEIEKDRIFYDESGEGGVTFSGGEPMSQPEFLKDLLLHCKQLDFHTTLDTTGFSPRNSIESIMEYVDVFLYDIKFIDNSMHQKYTGVSNKDILANLLFLSQNGKKIFIRIPIIPTINDTDEEIRKMISFISNLDHIERIDLLPFHKIGKEKYRRLGLSYNMEDFFEPSQDMMKKLKQQFESTGFPVNIGG